jgi:hypothetical protein
VSDDGLQELQRESSGAKRYIRVKATPDLSASGTDTAAISGVVVFGGQDSLPTS